MSRRGDHDLASRLDVTFGSAERTQDIQRLLEHSGNYMYFLDITMGTQQIPSGSAVMHSSLGGRRQAVHTAAKSANGWAACQCELPKLFATHSSDAGSPALSAASTDAGSSPGTVQNKNPTPATRKCQNCDSRADWAETHCQICGEALQTNFIGIMHSSASNSNLPVIVEPLHQFSRVKSCPGCQTKADWNAKVCKNCGSGNLIVEEKCSSMPLASYSSDSRRPSAGIGCGSDGEFRRSSGWDTQVVGHLDERLQAFIF